MNSTPARTAREAADLTLEQVARRVRRTPEYLAQCERSGRFSWPLAVRLARIYGARLDDFLPTPAERGTKQRPGRRAAGTGRAGRGAATSPSHANRTNE